MSDKGPVPPIRPRVLPRVLVVEDEPYLALEIDRILLDAGFVVVGPALGLRHALELARSAEIDIAVIDLNLGGETGHEGEAVADVLCLRNIPFMFATAHERETLALELRGFSHLQKPFSAQTLVRQLTANIRR